MGTGGKVESSMPSSMGSRRKGTSSLKIEVSARNRQVAEFLRISRVALNQVAKLLLQNLAVRRSQEGSSRGFRFQINRCVMVVLGEICEGFGLLDPVQEPVLAWVIVPVAIIATSGFS